MTRVCVRVTMTASTLRISSIGMVSATVGLAKWLLTVPGKPGMTLETVDVTAKYRRRGFRPLPFTRTFDLHLPEGARAAIFYQAPLSEAKR